MYFRNFILILKISIKKSLRKIKNDEDFHKVLGITYSVERLIKKNKKN